jgi:hypothetical protein
MQDIRRVQCQFFTAWREVCRSLSEHQTLAVVVANTQKVKKYSYEWNITPYIHAPFFNAWPSRRQL